VFDLRVLVLIKKYIIASFYRCLSYFISQISIFYYAEIAIVFMTVYLSYILLSSKRKMMGELIGIGLQIPQKIFTESKMVMKIITNNLIQ
jgi:hypothetical protein